MPVACPLPFRLLPLGSCSQDTEGGADLDGTIPHVLKDRRVPNVQGVGCHGAGLNVLGFLEPQTLCVVPVVADLATLKVDLPQALEGVELQIGEATKDVADAVRISGVNPTCQYYSCKIY